ncbi:MAG: heparinase, partial [Thermogutta sp.]|nr:heparinase [Thermogutta sp.]
MTNFAPIARLGRRPFGRLFVTGTVIVFWAAVTIGGPVHAEETVPSPDRVTAWKSMLPESAGGIGAPISDRGVWDRLAALAAFKGIPAQAAREAAQPLPEVTDELYLDFSKTGTRRRYEAVHSARRRRESLLVLAECLENRGRFLPDIERTLRAFCEEKSWVLPAHDRSLANFLGKTVEIDLVSSATGFELALTLNWLGDKLSPEVRDLVMANLERRVFQPFEGAVRRGQPRLWWLTTTNNWNAVCLANTTGAALAAIDDVERRAFFAASAEHFIRNFLRGFTPDGYCSEGIGYWNYGFGHYVILSDVLYRASGGKADLILDPAAAAPARFGYRMQIVHDIYPPFADCPFGSKPDPQLTAYLSRRLGFGLADMEERYLGPKAGPSGTLAGLSVYAMPDAGGPPAAKADRLERTLRDWFPDAGVLVARPSPDRPDDLAVALKGGHNAEHHNHNDVGSFLVVVGGEAVLVDPGAEVYTARTFDSRRYESKLLNSYGHPVPVVAGQLQRPGADAKGRILRTEFSDEADLIEIDMTSAYNVPELKTLRRTFVFRRGNGGSLTVTDRVEFSSPQEFEETLITFSPWKRLADNQLQVGEGKAAAVVTIAAGGRPYELKAEEIDEPIRYSKKPTRLGFR